MIWQCKPDNCLGGIISNLGVINDNFFSCSRFQSFHVRNQKVSIFRVFDPFNFDFCEIVVQFSILLCLLVNMINTFVKIQLLINQ